MRPVDEAQGMCCIKKAKLPLRQWLFGMVYIATVWQSVVGHLQVAALHILRTPACSYQNIRRDAGHRLLSLL